MNLSIKSSDVVREGKTGGHTVVRINQSIMIFSVARIVNYY